MFEPTRLRVRDRALIIVAHHLFCVLSGFFNNASESVVKDKRHTPITVEILVLVFASLRFTQQ